MNKNNNSIQEILKEFEQILKELDLLIFTKELKDIFELIYSYSELWNWLYINKTLFWYFLNKDFKDNKTSSQEISLNIDKYYNLVYSKIREKIDIINFYIDKLNNINDNNPKINILKWSFDYINNILNLVLKWLIFEARKAWMKNTLTPKETDKIVLELEEIDIKIFWWNVRTNTVEVKIVYNDFIKKYNSTHIKEEKDFFLKYVLYMLREFHFLENEKPFKNLKNKELSKDKENIFLSKDIKKGGGLYKNIFYSFWNI